MPPGIARVNWRSSLSSGLVAAFSAANAYGAPGPSLIPDLTGNISPLIQLSGGTFLRQLPEGLSAWSGSVSTGWISSTVPPSQQPANAFTLLYFGRLGTASQAYGYAIGIPYNGGGSAPYQSLAFQRGSSSTMMQLSGTFGGTSTTLVSPAIIGTSGIYCFVGAMSGSWQYIACNGQMIATSASAKSGSISYDAPAWAMNGGSGSASLQDDAFLAGLWNRMLTPAEALLLSANPTAFLQYPIDMLLSLTARRVSVKGSNAFLFM